MDIKYYTSLDGVTLDLSNQSLVDLDTPPVSIGSNVYINDDGTHTFISAKKSVNSSYNGDVFVYVYNSSSKTWSYQTSFYNLVYNGSNLFQTHEGNSGANPANFGKVVKTNDNATIAYIGIPEFRTASKDCGAIAIVERSNTTWSFLHFITNETSGGSTILANQRFGSAIAVGDSSLFVGTSTSYSYANAGVFYYDISGTTYTKDHTFDIKPTNTSATANFGTGLACSSDGMRLFVASDYYAHEVDSTNYYTGDVHIFYYNSSISSWVLIQSCYDTIKNNVTGAAIANGSGIGKQLEINSTGSKLLISTNLTNLHGKYGMVFYLEYEINGSTESYAFKQYLRSPVSNTISKPFGESLAISSDGNYMAIGTLSKNINIYHYDNTSYWQENETVSQSIIDDISSSEYTDTTMLDNYANSLSLNSDGKLMVLGISNYRYNNPSTISGKVSGQAFVYYAKGLQTIASFNNLIHSYDVAITLAATSNSSTTAQYSDPNDPTNSGNSVYDFTNSSTIQITGIGTEMLLASFSEDNDYLATTKTVTVTGQPVDQNIIYTAAISTQGSIGIGQTSGLVYEVQNAETGNVSDLSGVLSIIGNSVTFNPITSEIEGVQVGSSIVTISQNGNMYHNSAVPVSITYNVQATWSSPYPTNYNGGFIPNENGLDFIDTVESSITSSPDLGTIAQNTSLGLTKRDIDENQRIYSIDTLNSQERFNDLKRTTFSRDTSTFEMSVQDVSGSVDYMTVSLRDSISQIAMFTKMSIENKTILLNLSNKTDFIQIEKYINTGGNEYATAGSDSQYVTIRIYHPYESCTLYHVDENENLLEVNTTNFPYSSIQRDVFNTSYWYVKMPFSYAVATTDTNSSNAGDDGDEGNANSTSDYVCFLQGTCITCLDTSTKTEIEVPIEEINVGMYVKTYKHGFIPVKMLGYRTVKNLNNHKREKNRLYKCIPSDYPSLYKDLYITGCHSILEDEVTDKQYDDSCQILGEFYLTDGKCRLMAMCDVRAKPYASNKDCVIWHICLDHTDKFMNYGIYANGLLVESCSENNIQKAEYILK